MGQHHIELISFAARAWPEKTDAATGLYMGGDVLSIWARFDFWLYLPELKTT
jgi:hypothetical protein